MDYKTKAYYRDKIKEISKKTKISELYITQKALELAILNSNNNENKATELALGKTEKLRINSEKQSHIGYYLIRGRNKRLIQNFTNQ